ncbi:hypothetical protein Trydic_g19999 [Trypoxylus dichotomus]
MSKELQHVIRKIINKHLYPSNAGKSEDPKNSEASEPSCKIGTLSDVQLDFQESSFQHLVSSEPRSSDMSGSPPKVEISDTQLDPERSSLERLVISEPAVWDMDTIPENNAESLKKHLVKKQTAKFQRNDNTKQYNLNPSRTVVNLTDKILPPEAISILEKGGNFAVTPKSIPKEEIIANVEAAIRRPPTTEGDAVPIIQTDKDNATVIINTDEYKQKIKMLLEPPTYVTCQRDPTSSVLRETNKLVKVSSLPDNVKKQVIVTEAIPPRLYGLPKIQKRDVLLRPIVSAIGAPTYLLPKHLTTTATLHRRKSELYSRFIALRGKTREDTIQPGLRYIADLFPPDITQLFKHYLRTSFFVWDGSFYEQTDGVAMGNPVSPVIANLFMEQFESLAIETAVDKPTIRWRYVDDTFIV